VNLGEVASIIQDGKQTNWLLRFNQITANLVVEELNILPLNAFGVVLFLFCLQGELDENLLESLVYVIDAQLFETVFLIKKKS